MPTETPFRSSDGTSTTRAVPRPVISREHTLEIVSDAGEGAQKCGQIFGAVSAKMGNGVWTVEIIPAEIQPPPRNPEGASGYRIRIGSEPITNWGDETQLVLAFNEQVLLARHRLGALASDATILLEDSWASHPDEDVQRAWADALAELSTRDYKLIRVPMDAQCRTLVDNPRKGKNMFALGVLACVYARDLDRIRDQIAYAFRKKSEEVYATNVALLELGYRWAEEHLDLRIDVPAMPTNRPMVVMNGNEALGMGALAAGFELCAMYPITPATSASHFLGETFDRFGGILHQAEDEIAAAGVAIGASYAGKVALTITSGPGLALKTEFIGLAVMTETPLVVVDVQRGGPSTGLPTKVEQSDLLAVLYGQPGDAPKVVLAPSTIEECFHVMVTARRIAETFRCVVFVLSDANLATGVQPFPRPELEERWMRASLDLEAVAPGTKAYDWDPQTGLSRRLIPGQSNGAHTLTGLEHDSRSKVAYSGGIHQHSSDMRSRKLAVLQSLLLPPEVHGDDTGDLLVVGWGSTRGAIEEAVDELRAEGHRVSSTHLTFLSPLQPGLRELFGRFARVCTVELNYSDEPGAPYITAESRRYGQLAWLLRAHTLVDVDCWTRVAGEPLRPKSIEAALREKLDGVTAGGVA
jgi:2-oxoglutarate ferredoxin oxidoreductase subunit alpha